MLRSKVFLNGRRDCSPAATGFPNNAKTGMNKQVVESVRPRGGIAWDVHGDGRLAVRFVVCDGYDFMAGRVPQHRRQRAAVREPIAADVGAVRRLRTRATTRIRWSPTPNRRMCRSARSGRWSGHQLASDPVVERDGGAAARHGLGHFGGVSRQPLGSTLGAEGAETRRLHGSRPVHDQRRRVSRLLDTANLISARARSTRSSKEARSSVPSTRTPTSDIRLQGREVAAVRRRGSA